MAILHITNGDILSDRLHFLQIEGTFFTWREMLCEGPISETIGDDAFAETRASFLEETYDIPKEQYQKGFISQLELLDEKHEYDEIVLWFEFDLFCHINLLGALRLLENKNRKETISLVCSGRLPDQEGLKGLSDLTDKELLQHYENKIVLNLQDRERARQVWKQYLNNDPSLFTTDVARDTQFEYLSHCISAHKSRFPSLQNGLNTLENQILKLIDTYKIKTIHQLCGYTLNYQGFYGYGDMQIRRMISRLALFYTIKDGYLLLTDEGKAVLANQLQAPHMETDFIYGGARKYDFAYDRETHNIVKN